MAGTIPGKQWLTLSEASERLGVHPATLRAWADEGYVRTFRTPGGHRRFLAAEVEAMVAAAGEQEPPAGKELGRDLVTVARHDLSSLRGEGGGWLTAFPGEQREAWRESGRRLIGLAIQYVSRREGREAVIQEARAIGSLYGRQCAALGVPLSGTVRALLFFRESLLRSARPGLVARGRYDDEDARIHREMRQFLDEILYATLDAFEGASPAPAPGGRIGDAL